MANPGGTQRGGAAAQAATATDASRPPDVSKPAAPIRKLSGYGLPCSKCHLYYAADLDRCPTCHASDRVAPTAPKFPPRTTHGLAPAPQATSAAEQEREEFLKQFKAQLREAQAETAHSQGSACKLKEHHPGEVAAAEVCGACYERLQERVDVLEAGLNIDLKEAAQIVYDAVWANPSEPGKTYENAARALLGELRKRAGFMTVPGPFQPPAH